MAEGKSESRILKGPLAWEVARFGTPLAVGMALQTTFNLVDAYLIAQLPKDEVGAAVGAIGICDQVAALGTIVSFGVSTAAAALISNRKGAEDHEGVQRAAWQSILLIGALSVVLGVFGGLGAGVIVHDLIGAKGAVAEVATSYLRVAMLGSFSIYFLLQLTNIQRALGSAKTPVALLVAGNALNLVLAVLFIFGPGPAPGWLGWSTDLASALGIPRMGMIGAAWASILARCVVLLPNVIILARRFDVFPPKGKRGPSLVEMRQLVDIAWPSSAQFVLRISAMLLVNSLVARFFTTAEDQTATTAMGLVFRLDTMTLFVAMGWGNAAQTFVGQNLGAGEERRARRSGWLAGAYDVVTNVLLVAAIFQWGEAILRVFDDQTPPVMIALDYLHVVAPSYFALGLGIVLGNAMAGAGATRTTFAVDALVILAFELPICLVVVGALGGSLRTLFVCVAVTNVVSAIVYAIVYARGGWLASRARMESRPVA
ncbi:MAG: MATE family efflux transporter [Labilithrix sp.]|nr:MATE family efflux transporter [Labilithrix sp.]MBX3221184.1 MATE family efflux transporter [Labilithrix sp.]